MKQNTGKRKGFTLSEMIIALVIIGIVAMLSVPVLNKQTRNYDEGIYYMYKALVSFGRIINITSCNGDIDSFICNNNLRYACNDAGKAACPAESLTDLSDDEAFCNLMADTFRVADKNCSTFTNATIGTTAANFNDNIYGNIDKDTEPNLVLLNGYRIFISSLATYSFSHELEGENLYGSHETFSYVYNYDKRYRIITFDLNGYKKPNENGTDRISYLLWNDGSVILLGEPADNAELAKGAIRKFFRKKCDNCEEVYEEIFGQQCDKENCEYTREIFKANRPQIFIENAEGKREFISFRTAYCLASSYVEPNFNNASVTKASEDAPVAVSGQKIYGTKFFTPMYCNGILPQDDCLPNSDYVCDFYFPRPAKGVIDKIRPKDYYEDKDTHELIMKE